LGTLGLPVLLVLLVLTVCRALPELQERRAYLDWMVRSVLPALLVPLGLRVCLVVMGTMVLMDLLAPLALLEELV
jgi:hypothetical protein